MYSIVMIQAPAVGTDKVADALRWYLTNDRGPAVSIMTQREEFSTTYAINRISTRRSQTREIARITLERLPDTPVQISVNSKDESYASPIMLEMLVYDATTGRYPREWIYEPPQVRL